MTQTQVRVGADTMRRSIDVEFDSEIPVDVIVRHGSVDDTVSTDSVGVVRPLPGYLNIPLEYSRIFGMDGQPVMAAQEELLEQLKGKGYSEKDLFAVRLALEEAVRNCLKHAYSVDEGYDTSRSGLPVGYCPIRIGYSLGQDGVTIVVDDWGRGFNPKDVPDPTLDENLGKPTGRGLMLIGAYMKNDVHIYNQFTDKNYPLPGTRVVMKIKKNSEQSIQ